MGLEVHMDVDEDYPKLTGSSRLVSMSVNFFSKYPVRIIGLGIAIGETLKYVVSPDVTNMCSSVACTYILCHAAYQAFEARHENAIVAGMFDSLIYDGLASALIPTFITYHATRITFACLKESRTVPDIVITWGPTVMGLFMLSISTEPVDNYVNEALNDTIRKIYI